MGYVLVGMLHTVLERNNVTDFGEGEVIVYAHGFGCHQGMWDRITTSFRDTNRQVLFDYVGSGKSKVDVFKPEKYASLEGYVQDLLDVCDALELTGVTFVGHSVSCSVGILASIARPKLFERLILIGPNPCFVNDPPDYVGGFTGEDLEGLLALMDQNFIGWANYLAPVVSAQDAEAELTVELSDSFCSTDPVVAKVFARTTFFSDNRDELKKVSVPSLILQHQNDTLAPLSVGQFVHASIAGSTLQTLDVHGHCAHMSHPTLVVDAMRSFMDR